MASETSNESFKTPFKTYLKNKASGDITELVMIVKVTKAVWLVEQPRTKRVYAFARWAWERVKWN